MNFNDCHKKYRAHYKTIKQAYCPILGEVVHFTSKGFHHLRYDGSGHERSKPEQMYKMGLVPLLVPVVMNAKAVHEYKEKVYSAKIGKYFELWELRAHVGQQNTLVCVVLRRFGDGNIQFYSCWKKEKRRRPSQKQAKKTP